MLHSIVKLTAALLLSSLLSSFLMSPLYAGPFYAGDISKGSQQTFKSLTVNINTASAEEIADVLSGVGISKAKTIVAYRKRIGDFKTLDGLLGVKGIGAVTLEKNRHKLKL